MTDQNTLSYTPEHEWISFDAAAGTATIGITDYAATQLGDIVYVDLPDAGASVAQGAVIGEIESTKSVGELFAPFDAEVVEANGELESSPELINSDPFGEGWIVRVSCPAVPEGLLTHDQYRELTAS